MPQHEAAHKACDRPDDASRHSTISTFDLLQLSSEAGFFDRLPLECDGMVRAASAVLARDGIAHRPVCGRLFVEDVGVIARHCWITLASGQVLDLRARMWLGEDPRVPHGLFLPDPGTRYEPQHDFTVRPDAVVFMVLTGLSIAAAPALVVPSFEHGQE